MGLPLLIRPTLFKQNSERARTLRTADQSNFMLLVKNNKEHLQNDILDRSMHDYE